MEVDDCGEAFVRVKDANEKFLRNRRRRKMFMRPKLTTCED